MVKLTARALAARVEAMNATSVLGSSGLACLMVCLLIPESIPAAPGVDWHRWRGPDLNGISSEAGWGNSGSGEGPRRIWKASVGIGFSSVSVSQGRVFTMGNHTNRDSVFCFSAADGKLLWRHSYDCPLDPRYYDGGTSCTPTVEGDRVYTFSRKGHLFCLQAADGKVVWQRNLVKELQLEIPEWGFAGSPLVQDQWLLLNAGTAGLAVNKADGKNVWTTGTGPAGYSSPVPYELQGRRMVALAGHAEILGVELATGKVAWRYPWKTSYDINAADPVLAGSRLFVSSGYDHGGALLELTDGLPTLVWENKNLKTQFSTAVSWKGHLYGIDGNNGRDCSLKCLDLATGQVKWSQKGTGMGSLMAADGRLIVLWEKGELVVVDAQPEGYRERARTQALGGKNWTQPVLSQGQLYCRNAGGDLVCLGLRP